MRVRTALMMMACFVIACGAASGEERVYRQFKDVAVRENGKVIQSDDQKNLFECTYNVDMKNNTITRTKIRRLDDPVGLKDDNVYAIKEKRRLLPSEAGNGGSVLVAVEKNGHEILEMGHRFAFTTRTSPFSLVITGVYKRVYDKDHDNDRDRKWHKDRK